MINRQAHPPVAPIETMVASHDLGGQTEAIFTPELLPHLKNLAADQVAAGLVDHFRRAGIDLPYELSIDAFARYVELHGKRLAAVRLASRLEVEPNDQTPSTSHSLMVLGFNARSIDCLTFFRGSDHPIEISEPACANAIALLFGQLEAGSC